MPSICEKVLNVCLWGLVYAKIDLLICSMLVDLLDDDDEPGAVPLEDMVEDDLSSRYANIISELVYAYVV